MKKSLVALFVLGIMFVGSTNGLCEDDIFIDLSVLGEVNTSSVPSQRIEPASDNISVSVPRADAAQPVVQESSSSVISLLPVEPQFPVVKKPAVKKAEPSIKPAVKKELPKIMPKIDPIVVEPVVVPVAAAPVFVELATPEEMLKDVGLDESALPKSEEAKAPAEDVKEEGGESTLPAALKIEEEKLENNLSALTDAINNKKSEQADEAVVFPAAEGVAVIEELAKTYISFGENETELTDKHKSAIKDIVSKFENPAKNRMIIFSYALDSDEDVSKRRLQSVTRAGEVRKYLISLGYKNSGMKITNVSAETGRADTVEIIELK
ncbi:MAG: hypothetical protein LBR70_05610 [Lactobacillaceae bacterium]|jgi:outer membrane protein OmpA-like peptidoglycan-associated protein|nr:hypothetical protein [Lactobacillaceae bacterium]